MMMNYYSIERSMKLLKNGEAYHKIDKSDYAANILILYITRVRATGKVKELFANMHIPTHQKTGNHYNNKQEYGLYHAYRLAIAPTQSISYVQNATRVMPIRSN